MDCDAGIRPFTGDTEVTCERTGDHDGHAGTIRDYAYPGSATTIEWQEDDRRTFHGPWPGRCGLGGGCVLPTGHHGAHAL